MLLETKLQDGVTGVQKEGNHFLAIVLFPCMQIVHPLPNRAQSELAWHKAVSTPETARKLSSPAAQSTGVPLQAA
jgi:hypothetical protein